MSEPEQDDIEIESGPTRRPINAAALCAFGGGVLLIIILLYFAY